MRGNARHSLPPFNLHFLVNKGSREKILPHPFAIIFDEEETRGKKTDFIFFHLGCGKQSDLSMFDLIFG